MDESLETTEQEARAPLGTYHIFCQTGTRVYCVETVAGVTEVEAQHAVNLFMRLRWSRDTLYYRQRVA